MPTTTAKAGMSIKGQINIRISDQGKEFLAALQRRYGLSQAGVVEMLLRDRIVQLQQTEHFGPKKRLGD